MSAIDIDIEATLLALDDEAIKKQLTIPFSRISKSFAQGLSKEPALDLVYQFTKRYIKVVPGSIIDLETLAEQYHLQAIIEPCLQFSKNYLISTQKQVLEQSESDSLTLFLSLLESAYIFHRLAEELDDRVQHFIGIPITSMDRVNANIISHEILGDRFANKLDKAILSIFQQSTITKTIVEAQLDKELVIRQQKEKRSLSGTDVTCLAAESQLAMHF
jgi:hypothetical protein